MAKVGIGIIGSGFMGRTYSETISKHCPRGQLKAVAGGSRAAELASLYGMTHEPNVEALLRREDIQAVFIATPHHLHAEQALAAAGMGKDILLEKPMATSVADCDAINQACEAAGVWCSIAFTQRCRLCNIRAHEMIRKGRIGRIRMIQEYALAATGLAGLPAWQSNSENLGTLFGHAVHNFDRIRWLTGQEIRTVYAKCGSIEPEVKVEGSSMVLMSLSDGTTASLWASFQVPKPSFPRAQFSAAIIGERGLMDIDAYGELRVATGGEWEVEATQAPIDWAGKGFLDPVRLESYTLQCRDFIDAVADRRPPAVTGWDGRQAVAAALAAYESSRTGREITL